MTKLIVPALLCGIALGQLTVARFSTLTPWKGGGFGMFASVDRPIVTSLSSASMLLVNADSMEEPTALARVIGTGVPIETLQPRLSGLPNGHRLTWKKEGRTVPSREETDRKGRSERSFCQ